MSNGEDNELNESGGATSAAALVERAPGSAREGAAGRSSKGRHMDADNGGERMGDGMSRSAGTRSPGLGFFDVYKPTQGYNTRVWSGIGFGLMVAWGAVFVGQRLELMESAHAKAWQYGSAVAVILLFGGLGYWLLGKHRRVCDFLIATEGEMKKVNWTSRKEIIGSTKVVIAVLILMSILLFVIDIFFMAAFNAIGVLKGVSIWDLLGGGG